jgi:hypothetical protein
LPLLVQEAETYTKRGTGATTWEIQLHFRRAVVLKTPRSSSGGQELSFYVTASQSTSRQRAGG